MQLQNGGGDRLASGASRAQFRPMGEAVSQEKWNSMWEGFDPEAYKKDNQKTELPSEAPDHYAEGEAPDCKN